MAWITTIETKENDIDGIDQKIPRSSLRVYAGRQDVEFAVPKTKQGCPS